MYNYVYGILCCTTWQVMDLLMEGSPLVGKLMENTHRFRTRMNEAGFNLGVRDFTTWGKLKIPVLISVTTLIHKIYQKHSQS